MDVSPKPGMVLLTGKITIPQRLHDTLLPLLEEHTALTRKEPGCLRFTVTQDQSDPELFHVDECFIDEAAFAQHQAHGAARPWGPASVDLKRDFTKTTV